MRRVRLARRYRGSREQALCPLKPSVHKSKALSGLNGRRQTSIQFGSSGSCSSAPTLLKGKGRSSCGGAWPRLRTILDDPHLRNQGMVMRNLVDCSWTNQIRARVSNVPNRDGRVIHTRYCQHTSQAWLLKLVAEDFIVGVVPPCLSVAPGEPRTLPTAISAAS